MNSPSLKKIKVKKFINSIWSVSFLPPKNAIETLRDNAHRKEYMPVQGNLN